MLDDRTEGFNGRSKYLSVRQTSDVQSFVIPGPDVRQTVFTIHAKNKFVGRIIQFLVLDFWDKNTGICGHYRYLGI